MTRRNAIVWSTVVAGTLVSLWACTHHGSPGAPSAADTTQQVADGAGGMRGLTVATPTPIGPTPRPVGPSAGGVGPSARPVGPTARPVGPVPTGIGPSGGGTPPPDEGGGSNSGSGGTGGGGGGGATACNTLRLTSTDTPITSNTAGSQISVDPSLTTCLVRSVKVGMYATVSSGASLADFAFEAAGVSTANHSALLFSRGTFPAGGAGIGSSCANVTFSTSGPIFPSGSPPYTGNYAAVGSLAVWEGESLPATWTFRLDFTPSASAVMTLECWQLEVELEPPPTPTP